MIAEIDPILSSLHGDIVCEHVAGGSALTRIYSRAPLKLISTDPVGKASHVVMSSFGGGMVTGDEISIRLQIEAHAQCVLTTQSSSKVYRSREKGCMQSVSASVGDDAVLAILPDPLCCFGDSRFTQKQQFDVDTNGNLVWLDWITSGRWARDERWAFDRYESATSIFSGNRMVIRETLALDQSEDISGIFKMGRFNCYAVMVMIGPKIQPMIEHADKLIQQYPLSRNPDFLASFSPISGGAVVRLLGPNAQYIQDQLRTIFKPLADVFGQQPWARKW